MPDLTKRQKQELARAYWKIKDLGTVEELFREFGVSKPTGLKIAREFQPKVKAPPNSTGQGMTTQEAV